MDNGTATRPRPLALLSDGLAPALFATRIHRNHASDPVTKRFGPRFSPTRSENGCGGVRAAKSDAAGRLFAVTEVSAATPAVAQRSRCDRRCAGPDQRRPSV